MNPHVPPHPEIHNLVCGEFLETQDYAIWRTEGTDDWLLIYTLNGGGLITTGAGAWTVGAHEALLYEPGTRHDYRTAPSANAWRLLWCHFHPRTHWLPWLAWPERSPGVRTLQLKKGPPRTRLQDRFCEAIRVRVGTHPMAEDLAMNAFAEVLIHCATSAAEVDRPVVDERVRAAMDFLVESLDEPFRLERVAAIVGLSPSRLAHLFKEQTGTSLQQFSEARRLHHAAELLRYTARTVKDIAYSTGYQSPYYFSLRFKAWSGTSPSRYRHQVDLTQAQPNTPHRGPATG